MRATGRVMPSGSCHSLGAVLGAQRQGQPGSYERRTEEFSRVLAFSDAVFAIPFQVVARHWKPPEADRYLAH
jgi:hypothetical protein